MSKPSARSNQRTTLPQSRPVGRASSLKEGAGRGAYHSSHHSKTATLRAIFIAPTKLKRFWHLPFNERHSLSHALSGVPAPSEREPGGLAPFNRVLAEIRGFGRFSSPLRNSKDFGFYHTTYRSEVFTFHHRATRLQKRLKNRGGVGTIRKDP